MYLAGYLRGRMGGICESAEVSKCFSGTFTALYRQVIPTRDSYSEAKQFWYCIAGFGIIMNILSASEKWLWVCMKDKNIQRNISGIKNL